MARGDRFLARGFQFSAFVILAVLVTLLETAYVTGLNDPMEWVYVDIARHVAKGEGITTSMLAPYYMSKLPAPIWLWPPLYPETIASVTRLGIDAPVAARIVSIVAFGLSVGLVWLLGSILFGQAVGVVSALLFSLWPSMTQIAGRALSEELFRLLVLVSALISVQLIRVRQVPAREYLTAAVGGLAMGAAGLTRYAGIALIPIGAAALLLSIRGRAWRDRLAITTIWSAVASVGPAILLIRNLLVTGALTGAGRPPDDKGIAYHSLYAMKVIASDSLQLFWRMTIVPEVLGFDSRLMAIPVLGVIGLLLFLALRNEQFRKGLIGALRSPVASPESRFLVAIAVGYCAAMLIARSMIGFELLHTRMLMPVYPLLLIGFVAFLVALVDKMKTGASKFLTWVVISLWIGSVAVVIFPRSLAAGGPRLRPGPMPTWVNWVAANTQPDALIVGNRGFDYNFYLQRSVLSFSGQLDYRTMTGYLDADTVHRRFDRDCPFISRHLVTLRWKHAYLILRAEDSQFDASSMGSRYGPKIERLLNGELTLPVRPIVRKPDFAAYEILDASWNCSGG